MAVDVTRVSFSELDKWSQSPNGDLVHDSGKFFRICGGEAKDTKTGEIRRQPVIDQPEQGILGIISRERDNTIEILLQAKIEPGNLDSVQYSPTVQATRSNYTGAHKGKGVEYIESFLETSPHIVSRGFQSEHGYKFFKKANDNVYVVDDMARINNNKFVWINLAEVRALLSEENFINMDTRSVLATIDFIGKPLSSTELLEIESFVTQLSRLEKDLLISSLSDVHAITQTTEIIAWIDGAKASPRIKHKLLPLKELRQSAWCFSEDTVSHQDNRNFELVGVRASIGSREVSSWYQPIVRDNVPKAYVLLLKKLNGTMHALIQMVEEDFSWNGAELGPTIHSATAKDLNLDRELESLGIDTAPTKIVYDRFQSEEGGRFMEQENRYLLAVAQEDTPITTPENHRWVTLYQLKKMTARECNVNIEARTLLTIASYYKD